jgi:hypothetical protein
VVDPVPLVNIPPGERVRVHVPDEGRLPNNTLPAGKAQVGWVIATIDGAVGSEFTCTAHVAITSHASGDELMVFTVIVTILPASAGEGA